MNYFESLSIIRFWPYKSNDFWHYYEQSTRAVFKASVKLYFLSIISFIFKPSSSWLVSIFCFQPVRGFRLTSTTYFQFYIFLTLAL